MFVFLSKLLPLFLYPIGLVFALGVIALLLNQNERLRKIILGGLVLIIFLSGNRWISMGLVRTLEWQYLPEDEYPSADCIVVLGGGTQSSAYPRSLVEMNGAGDRLLYAAELYHAGNAPIMLLSGGRIAWMGDQASTPADEMATILMMLNVPEEQMILESNSLNTYENAVYSAGILEEMQLEKILLVTSAMHMPRAVALFEAQGLDVTAVPGDYALTEEGWYGLMHPKKEQLLLNLIPQMSNVSLVTLVMKEYFGIWTYKLMGRL